MLRELLTGTCILVVGIACSSSPTQVDMVPVSDLDDTSSDENGGQSGSDSECTVSPDAATSPSVIYLENNTQTELAVVPDLISKSFQHLRDDVGAPVEVSEWSCDIQACDTTVVRSCTPETNTVSALALPVGSTKEMRWTERFVERVELPSDCGVSDNVCQSYRRVAKGWKVEFLAMAVEPCDSERVDCNACQQGELDCWERAANEGCQIPTLHGEGCVMVGGEASPLAAAGFAVEPGASEYSVVFE